MSTKPALLYLVHRIPFPPNKGDKVRSYHLLRQLARDYRVFLGCFVDIQEDWQYLPALKEWCEEVHAAGISPRMAKLASLRGLVTGEALTLPYYRQASMRRWVGEVCKQHAIRRVVVFSSSMAQYVPDQADIQPVIDFVDVDSAKWTRYADDHPGPLGWLYRREGHLLAAYERAVAARASASVLVSDAEAELFRKVAPAHAVRTHAISNGVNADFFSPQHELATPYEPGAQAVVFTGAMDYWPNIDAACWFASDVWPLVRELLPQAVFYVVGMNPAAELRALDGRDGIVVTGTVPDVRPYVRHAAVVVAPLRVARGVQNKILEAMSMARPVIASRECAVGVHAEQGSELLVADGAQDFAARVIAVLRGEVAEQLGARARERVLASYSWDAHLSVFPGLIEASVRLSEAESVHA